MLVTDPCHTLVGPGHSESCVKCKKAVWEAVQAMILWFVWKLHVVPPILVPVVAPILVPVVAPIVVKPINGLVYYL